jgi:2-oxo-3-hexenedioate decarboxylase
MATTLDIKDLASEILAAYANRTRISAPTTREPNFDLTDAYAVEAEIVRLRKAAGQSTVGRKVGFANKAEWQALRLETLVWAHMYDDTVHQFPENSAILSLEGMVAPKIETEIVFKIKKPLAGSTDPAAILGSVEWLALGFEIIDCVFPDWQFQPADLVAARGFHTGLIVGTPWHVGLATIPLLAEQLPQFKVRLSKNGQFVEEGSGKNSLHSPALCLGELAGALSRRPGSVPLSPGELVSSGALTTPTLIAVDQEWTAEIDGLDLPSLTLRLSI